MRYSLSESMNMRKLFRASIPSILMMISISVYSVVDGFFVSNFAGKTAFAAVNMVWPIIMVLGSLGFMMGTGGSALVAKRFGEGQDKIANEYFGNCVIFSIVGGATTSVITYFLLPYILEFLGADAEMMPHCLTYGRILVLGITSFHLQNLFQSFLVAAEKPNLGFVVTLAAGVTNIALDAILIAGFKMGVRGAAIGTVAGQMVGGIAPLIYFLKKNDSLLQLRHSRFHFKALFKMMGNGASEFFNNISASLVSMALNYFLMRYYGQDGVGAYGTICYVWLIFAACFIGYDVAVAPRISYALGAGNKKELRVLYRSSIKLLIIFGIVQLALAEALAVPLAYAFANYDEGLRNLTIHASLIYSVVYLFIGINMFGSSFFTALNNGLVSILLSLVRLLGFELLSVCLLHYAFGGEGLWIAVPFANALGVAMNLIVMHALGKRYGYVKPRDEKEQEPAAAE